MEQMLALKSQQNVFIQNKDSIISQWISYPDPKAILLLHKIEPEFFLENYAGGVFDYFMRVIAEESEIGNCLVMQGLLSYLKNREISADELFAICSHFRRSMIDFSYDAGLNSKELFDELSYIFDENFKGILKFYTDTMFQKLIDARQNALKAGEAKEYFLSNMSHEIRTPLNAILGFVNILLDEDMEEKQKNYLDIIHSSGSSLLNIINDILDFSKLRSGSFQLEYKNFSLHEELSYTIELFTAQVNVKNIRYISFIDPKIPMELYGDVLRIKQILANFLSNAIKFTPNNGLIEVEVYYKKDALEVSVKDNGIGIDEQDVLHVFDAFSQAKNSSESNIAGTGLGLSICKTLAQKMQGEVSVISKRDKGSTFKLVVPVENPTSECKLFIHLAEYKNMDLALYAPNKQLREKEHSFIKYAQSFDINIEIVDSLDTPHALTLFVYESLNGFALEQIFQSEDKFIAMMSKEYEIFDKYSNISSLVFPLNCDKIERSFESLVFPNSSIQMTKKIAKQYKGHILVAEDNEANQELIKIILSKYGLTFDIANNGLAALQLYKQKSYDFILMDEKMPVMNGHEAVLKILEYEQFSGKAHTPISALTANVLKGVKERDLLIGYDAFLGKPIVLKELERVFSNYLKVDKKKQPHIEVPKSKPAETQAKVVGLNMAKLQEDLMLEEGEVIMLLELFLKKMKISLPKLEEAIAQKEFTLIAQLAHAIKGSSANFRLKEVQELSSEIELFAKTKDKKYDFSQTYTQMQELIEGIQIS